MDLHLDLQIAVVATDLPGAAELHRWAEAALAAAAFTEPAELTVRLVDAAESAALNAAYRGQEHATNVLSFPFETPPGVELDAELLGDLVICAPVVMREAAEQGKAPAAHWAHMVVHGTLHLLGYDHEDEADAVAMERLETGILGELGFPDPYQDDEHR